MVLSGADIVEEINPFLLTSLSEIELAETEEYDENSDHFSDDTLDIYLREMAAVPLLSHQEEIDLARRFERGKQAQLELANTKGRISKRRLAELKALISDGLAAREHLIKANTRLVISIARRYIGCGVPLSDLIQEGNLGLIRAVEKFEYQRGFRFSTYATWWIRQAVMRAIAMQSRTIRLPVYLGDRVRQFQQVAHALEQELGRPPTLQELAQELNVTPEKVHWVMQMSQTPLSLEDPYGDEEDSEFGVSLLADFFRLHPRRTNWKRCPGFSRQCRNFMAQRRSILCPRLVFHPAFLERGAEPAALRAGWNSHLELAPVRMVVI